MFYDIIIVKITTRKTTRKTTVVLHPDVGTRIEVVPLTRTLTFLVPPLIPFLYLSDVGLL